MHLPNNASGHFPKALCQSIFAQLGIGTFDFLKMKYIKKLYLENSRIIGNLSIKV
jgi:hypothetical protein